MAGELNRGRSDAGRLLRAFLWLRWRTLANSLGAGGRRTLGARLRAWGEVAVKVLLALFLAVAALGLAAGAVFAGPALLGGGEGRGVALLVVRLVLAALVVSLLFFSVFQAARGGVSRATRLLLLPVSRRRLHGLELAASLGDPWLLAVVPALLLLALGTAVLRPAGAAALLLATALLLALLAVLSATASFAVQLLLRERRRAEWVTLVVFVVWMALAVLPSLFEDRLDGDEPAADTPAAATQGAVGPDGDEAEEADEDDEDEAPRGERLARRAGTFPLPLQPVPTEAYALVLARASAPDGAAPDRWSAWQGVAVLAVEVALLYALSLALWRRLLADPAGGSSSRRAAGPPLPTLAPPGLTPAATAVAWALVRGVWRTLQGRLALVMPSLTLPVFAIVFRPEGGEAALPVSTPALLALAAVALALLGQQAVMLNQFGVDGTGLSLELLAPLPARDLVLGKAAGGAVLTLASLLPALLVVAAFNPRAPLLLWPAAVLAAVAGYALFAPLAAWVSVLLPKAVDLGKIGREGQAHQGAALAGMACLGMVLSPVAAVGLAALALWRSPLLLLVAESGLAAVSCLVSVPLLHLAAGYLDQRRERLFLTVAEEE